MSTATVLRDAAERIAAKPATDAVTAIRDAADTQQRAIHAIATLAAHLGLTSTAAVRIWSTGHTTDLVLAVLRSAADAYERSRR